MAVADAVSIYFVNTYSLNPPLSIAAGMKHIHTMRDFRYFICKMFLLFLLLVRYLSSEYLCCRAARKIVPYREYSSWYGSHRKHSEMGGCK